MMKHRWVSLMPGALLLLAACDTSSPPVTTPTPLSIETAPATPVATNTSSLPERDAAATNAVIAAMASPTLTATSTSASTTTTTTAVKREGCLPSERFPESLTLGDATETKLHFKRSGCGISITHVEIAISDSYTRTVAFNPPLDAGAVMDYEVLPHEARSSGSFTGQAEIGRGDIKLRLEQQGTYSANSRVEVVEPLGREIKQWASDAKASSEYGASDWSAKQTIGEPDTLSNASLPTAWAPKNNDGTMEWLELTYTTQVYVTGLNIRESFNPGFVTQVEVFDSAGGQWRVIWRGKDTTTQSPAWFSPPLSDTSIKSSRVRVTIDTNTPGWNEIDAVELVGRDSPEGSVVWARGSWVEEGTAKICDTQDCEDMPWANQPTRTWYWAFNTVTGKVGITPDQVR